MKKSTNFDLLIFLLVIILYFFIRPDLLVMSAYILLMPYLVYTKRKYLIPVYTASFIFGLVWVLFTGHYYDYGFGVRFGRVNFYLLFAWALGLFGGYLFYLKISQGLKIKNRYYDFFLFSLFYSLGLISLECTAYHVFNIHNILAQQYSGLPYINCIHAPFWMKCTYFLIGPMYYLFSTYLLKKAQVSKENS